MRRHPILPSQMVAIEDGRDTYFYGNGNCAARDVVTYATREHERAADKNTPRTRAAVIRAIEHRDDYANTVF